LKYLHEDYTSEGDLVGKFLIDNRSHFTKFAEHDPYVEEDEGEMGYKYWYFHFPIFEYQDVKIEVVVEIYHNQGGKSSPVYEKENGGLFVRTVKRENVFRNYELVIYHSNGERQEIRHIMSLESLQNAHVKFNQIVPEIQSLLDGLFSEEGIVTKIFAK
jgi:hypothetical protein